MQSKNVDLAPTDEADNEVLCTNSVKMRYVHGKRRDIRKSQAMV